MRGAAIVLFFLSILLTACTTPQPPPMAPAAQMPPTPASRPVTAVPAAQPAPAERPRATGTPEDARRHMVRGTVAIEMARSDADLANAEEEFRLATEIDPTMAAAWFNLGAVQARTGRYEEAVASYNRYLALSPDAEDAPRIRDEVIKLQYRQEQSAKTRAHEGLWTTEDASGYWFTMQGDRITLSTEDGYVPEDEVTTTFTLGPSTPAARGEKAAYHLTLRGDQLSGTWTREPLQEAKCVVPGETTPVTGELNDREGTTVLRHTRTRYRTKMSISLMSDYCGEVEALGTKQVEKKFYGPLPKGGIGVALDGLRKWWDGGFSSVQFGWQGRLAIRVAENSPAYAAGLRDKDEILAIDGVPVRELTAGGAVMRMRGRPGTPITLTVWRKDLDTPFDITMQRLELRQ